MGDPDHLTPEQQALWDTMRPSASNPGGLDFAIQSFRYACDLDGLGDPSDAAIEAALSSAA